MKSPDRFITNGRKYIKLGKSDEIKRVETEILLKALGPIGMAEYLEEYDNGGTGDYTREKYEQPNYSIQEILDMII